MYNVNLMESDMFIFSYHSCSCKVEVSR
jgi:hypothetical protein